nr:hypothetical protein [Tanacetum cinerariifolium]
MLRSPHLRTPPLYPHHRSTINIITTVDNITLHDTTTQPLSTPPHQRPHNTTTIIITSSPAATSPPPPTSHYRKHHHQQGCVGVLHDLSGLKEFVNEPIVSKPTIKKPVVETSEAKASVNKPKVVRKNFSPPLIEDWISDSEDEAESKPKIEKRTIKPSFAKIEFVQSKKQVKSPRKTTVKQGNQNRLNTNIPRGNQRN